MAEAGASLKYVDRSGNIIILGGASIPHLKPSSLPHGVDAIAQR